MSPKKYKQIWGCIISKTIDKYISKNNAKHPELQLELAVKRNELEDNIYNTYELYKKFFKERYMAKIIEKDEKGIEDIVEIDANEKKKIDRHKVASLLYLSIVYSCKKPFIRVKGKRDNNYEIGIEACHKIAYSIALNCIYSFIDVINRKSPDQHRSKFLNNKGFQKTPYLICEKYADYGDSIILRMTLMTINNMSYDRPKRLVCFDVIMLANIFYFLELYAAS
jgi:hypothetical protein